MSRRHGRNKRRADRNRIAELEAQAAELNASTRAAERRATAAEYRLSSAREDAFKDYARQTGLLQKVMQELSREMALRLVQDNQALRQNPFLRGRLEAVCGGYADEITGMLASRGAVSLSEHQDYRGDSVASISIAPVTLSYRIPRIMLETSNFR